MPVVPFEVSGAGKIPAEYDKIGAATEKAEKKAAKLGQTYRTTAAEAAKFHRLEKQLIGQTETALERYNRKWGEAKKALAGNAREAEILVRVQRKLREEFVEQARAERGTLSLSEKRLARQRQLAEESVKAEKAAGTARAREAHKTFLRIAQSEREAAAQRVAATEAAEERMAKAANKRFLSIRHQERQALAATQKQAEAAEEALENLKGGGKALATVVGGAFTGVIKLVRDGLLEMHAEIDRARQQVEGARGTSGTLRQLANNQGDLDKLKAQAVGLFLTGGVEELSQAEQIIFDIGSAQLLDDESLGLLSQAVRKKFFESPSGIARAVSATVGSFGKEEAGNLQQILAKADAAGFYGTSSTNALLEAASQSAAAASLAGISDEENLAAVTVLGKATGSDTEGATILNSLLFSLSEIENKVKDSQGQLDAKQAVVDDLDRRITREEEKIAARGQAHAAKIGRQEEEVAKAELAVSRAKEDQVRAARTKSPADNVGARRRLADTEAKLADEQEELAELREKSATSQQRLEDLKRERTAAAAVVADQRTATALRLPANFASLSFEEKIKAVEGLGLSPADQLDLLGRKEAVKAADKLGIALGPGAPLAYQDVLQRVEAANADQSKFLGKFALVDPLADAALAVQQEKNRQVVEDLAVGQASALADSLQARRARQIREREIARFGDNAVGRDAGAARSAAFNKFVDLSQSQQGDFKTLQALIEQFPQLATAEEKATAERLVAQHEELKKQTRILEEIRDNGGLTGSGE